jgi:serine/threonine protein kinase
MERSVNMRIKMKSIGIPLKISTEVDFKELVRDILHGLRSLHENGYVHCDIREPNILMVPEDIPTRFSKYILIDFEEGRQAGLIWDKGLLADWDDTTLDADHTTSDMYQFGKMLLSIMDKEVQMSTAEMGNFIHHLIQQRPSAEVTLQHEYLAA